MPTGPGGLDANGIWQYGEDDTEALASDLLNLGMGSVSTAVSGLEPPAILQVVSTTKTDTFSASVTTGASVAVTDLTITHTLASASNKLLITANFGVAGTTANDCRLGIAVADGATLLNLGDADGSRTRVSTGGITHNSPNINTVSFPSTQFLYSPGDTASHTYSIHVINVESSTRTLYVNRSYGDANGAALSRGSSTLTIMEVAG